MVGKKILLVEDDESLKKAICESLQLRKIDCKAVSNGDEAIKLIPEYCPTLILSDVKMRSMSGLELLRKVRSESKNIPIILMTAYGNIESAVEAIKLGANDYLLKPFSPELLVKKIEFYSKDNLLVGNLPIVVDKSSIDTIETAQKVAKTNVNVMITGESGTGKEILARYIHNNSDRKNNKFIPVNCASIPENMLESILFGHEKGSFTGAYKLNIGKFEQANKGTILLDEITEMDLSLQAKILRVLQEKEVERVGGKNIISLDVRVIATTNRDIKKEVRSGRFREDLYFRLNVFPIKWRPLRDRKDDILPLVEFFLQRYCGASNQIIPKLDEKAKTSLLNHQWPGNIRELENVIQRALVLHNGDIITSDHFDLENDLFEQKNTIEIKSIDATVEKGLSNDLRLHEYNIISDALSKNDGNRKKVSKTLGISERTLRYKLAKMKEEGIVGEI